MVEPIANILSKCKATGYDKYGNTLPKSSKIKYFIYIKNWLFKRLFERYTNKSRYWWNGAKFEFRWRRRE